MQLRVLSDTEIATLFDLIDVTRGDVVIVSREELDAIGVSEKKAAARLDELRSEIEWKVFVDFAITPDDALIRALSEEDDGA